MMLRTQPCRSPASIGIEGRPNGSHTESHSKHNDIGCVPLSTGTPQEDSLSGAARAGSRQHRTGMILLILNGRWDIRGAHGMLLLTTAKVEDCLAVSGISTSEGMRSGTEENESRQSLGRVSSGRVDGSGFEDDRTLGITVKDLETVLSNKWFRWVPVVNSQSHSV
ncbi:hypothetical protein TNIN_400551 [Trichonephila inaurata madagascariensis]|uniref:Uncharacterized protein n=1 Tax=Trichonephila inaurata madagascariensis TaxID=2747483 RepID=A0A8X6X108_9ARAC|nr:hypothetical protein TNIN_400551 [Trichonephila inaurata madagascariensis]